MAVWGTSAFENDHAADFAVELEYCPDRHARTGLLTAKLDALIEREFTAGTLDESYELPSDVECAIAAAAYVADTRDSRFDFTDNVFAQGYDVGSGMYRPIRLASPTEGLIQKARTALHKILRQMEADGIGEGWQNTVREIQAALNQ